jgi:hypothetical protein
LLSAILDHDDTFVLVVILFFIKVVKLRGHHQPQLIGDRCLLKNLLSGKQIKVACVLVPISHT